MSRRPAEAVLQNDLAKPFWQSRGTFKVFEAVVSFEGITQPKLNGVKHGHLRTLPPHKKTSMSVGVHIHNEIYNECAFVLVFHLLRTERPTLHGSSLSPGGYQAVDLRAKHCIGLSTRCALVQLMDLKQHMLVQSKSLVI